MKFGDFKILVPAKSIFDNKEVNTLTKTGKPTTRQKQPSILLKNSSNVHMPMFKLNVPDSVKIYKTSYSSF